MKYEQATWRIRVAKDSFVEISVVGCKTDRETAEPIELLHAAAVLKEVGQAIQRIALRWKKVEETR